MKRVLPSLLLIAFVAMNAVGADKLPGEWAEKITVKGDLRYRHEWIDDDSKDVDRHRHRIRARVGAYADVNDTVKAGVRLASGSDDPVSSNQTLDDSFSSKGINLDLAYFQWSPEETPFKITGGKMKKPWICVGDLIWDGDLNPEGLALNVDLGGDMVDLLVHAGGYWLDEISSSDDDIMLYAGQVALELKPAEKTTITIGGSYFDYENVEEGTTVLVGNDPDDFDSFGNAATEITEPAADPMGEPVVVDLVYNNGFKEYEAFVEIAFDAGVPVTLFADYVVNDEADDADTGYQVGVSLKPGNFKLGYNYRNLEANAVLGAFSDSDFAGGGTNGEGHKLSAAYKIAKNWELAGTYFINEKDPDGAAVDYQRVQVDLKAKF